MFRLRSRFFSALTLLPLLILARPALAAAGRWTPLGPEGGTVQALKADPGSPGTLYAGTDGGGVWKSTDGGTTWRSANEGFGSPDVHALAVSPGDPGAVWAGTGGGIFQSTDAGATWRRVWHESSGPLDTTPWIVSLAADPIRPGVVWAGNERGWILKTTDGGATWTRLQESGGHTLLIDPLNPETVYANGLKTTDGGATWQTLDSHGEILALDLSNPRVLYSSDFDGLWKSADAGASWTRLPGFEGRAESLLVDPSDPDVLLAGQSGRGPARSEDGGQTWRQVPGLPLMFVPALEADPAQPGRIWLGANERAVFRSLDSGRTWKTSRQGLDATHLFAAAFDPFRPRTLYVAANSLGVHRSADSGGTWSRINKGLPTSGGYGVSVNTVAAHPTRSGTLYAGTGAGTWRSLDRGKSWSLALDEGDVHAIAFHPRKPGMVFSGGDHLFRSRDNGRTWKRLTRPDTFHDSEIAGLVISPLRPQTVFALDINERRGTAETLFRSPDEGNTWTTAFTRGPAALASHPSTPGLLYLATETGGEIWTSADDGLTWEKVAEDAGGGALLTSLLVDRIDPSILYLGTFGAGVWRSTDHGSTWEPFATGLIAPRITCLEADPRNPRRMVACTWGGGLLEIQISSGS